MRKMFRVVVRAFAICAGIYTLVALCGYLLFGSATQGDILNNFDTKDNAALIARLGLAFVIVFTYPLAFHSLRSSVFTLGPSDWRQADAPRMVFPVVTCVLVMSILLLGLASDHVEVVLAYVCPTQAVCSLAGWLTHVLCTRVSAWLFLLAASGIKAPSSARASCTSCQRSCTRHSVARRSGRRSPNGSVALLPSTPSQSSRVMCSPVCWIALMRTTLLLLPLEWMGRGSSFPRCSWMTRRNARATTSPALREASGRRQAPWLSPCPLVAILRPQSLQRHVCRTSATATAHATCGTACCSSAC